MRQGVGDDAAIALMQRKFATVSRRLLLYAAREAPAPLPTEQGSEFDMSFPH